MRLEWLSASVIAGAWLTATPLAHATPYTAELTGVLVNSSTFTPIANPATSLDGAAVSGSFTFDPSDMADPPFDPDHSGIYGSYATGVLHIGDAPGQPGSGFDVLLNGSGGELVTSSVAGSEPVLTIQFYFGDPHSSDTLQLAGPFFDANMDLSTFTPGPVDLANSFLSVHSQFEGYGYNAHVDLTSFTFDGQSTAVPEPASLALLALPMGVAGLIARGRRRAG